jgi:hypothetical protein
MPDGVTCAGREFRHVDTFKHDFFAATGLYRDSFGQLVVLKLGRQTDLGLIPLRWIGEFLTRRETRLYRRFSDLAGVPALIGNVGRNGLLHAFVPGHPLGEDEAVSNGFFDELERMLAVIHARGSAYVDLNKRQNILVGDDGRPYLIDFQISLDLPPRGWRRLTMVRWLLRRFQEADRYHLLKHKRRLRPDLLRPEERARLETLSPWIRLHRRLARPLTEWRRKALRKLEKSETTPVAGSTAK